MSKRFALWAIFALLCAPPAQAGIGSSGRAYSQPICTLVSGCTVAYGLRKLRAAYSGKAVNIRRSSDNTFQDIGFTSFGDFDVNAFQAFVGAGSGFVKIWYDQSGNGNDVSQGVNANQPLLVLNALNGRPALDFSAGTSVGLVGSALAGITFSVYAVAKSGPAGGAGNTRNGPLSTRNAGNQGWSFDLLNNGTVDWDVRWFGASAWVVHAANSAPGAATWGRLAVVLDSTGGATTNTDIYVNNANTASSHVAGRLMVASAQGIAVGIQTGTAGGTGWEGQTAEGIVYSAVINATQQAVIDASEKEYFRMSP